MQRFIIAVTLVAVIFPTGLSAQTSSCAENNKISRDESITEAKKGFSLKKDQLNETRKQELNRINKDLQRAMSAAKTARDSEIKAIATSTTKEARAIAVKAANNAYTTSTSMAKRTASNDRKRVQNDYTDNLEKARLEYTSALQRAKSRYKRDMINCDSSTSNTGATVIFSKFLDLFR